MSALTNLQAEFLIYHEWRERGFCSPAPDYLKSLALMHHLSKLPREGTVFIESGTHTGNTAKLVAEGGYKVVTIELMETLYNHSRTILEPLGVTCRQGDSSVILGNILRATPIATNLFFWLDGHYSGIGTARGATDTSVSRELLIIEEHLPRAEGIVFIKVNDIHLFGKGDYPSMDQLANFASRNFLFWTIENDSFIATNRRELFLPYD